MSGLITVDVVDPAPEYTAACGCGWVGEVETAIEWSEVALLSHLAKHGEKEAA